MTEDYINIDEQKRLFFRDTGGSFPVILFGHSLSFDGTIWNEQIKTLSKHFRIITIDFYGHGKSSSPNKTYSLEDVADDLIVLMNYLSLEKIAYAGLSIGGMIGMRLALRHPDRIKAMALLNTSAEAEDPQRRKTYEQYNEMSHNHANDNNKSMTAIESQNNVMSKMLTGLMFSSGFRKNNPETIKSYEKQLTQQHSNLYWITKALLARKSIRNDLKTLHLPVLVVTSENDVAIPSEHPRYIAETIPNATLVTLPQAGHMTPLECPEKINTLLYNFYSTHLTTKEKIL